MTSKKYILHFTLGPVQGFISDARRLRDFWAGSFLLSWLSGHAMKAVKDAGGEVIFPTLRGDELFAAIEKPSSGTPFIGSLPNRFKARVPEGFDPKTCKEAIKKAWEGLAQTIWEQFVGKVASCGFGTAEIWSRQVENFWDMAWVIGPKTADHSDGRWLDQRKNWRTHREPDEPNALCSIMGRYQELSGFSRMDERNKRQTFWSALSDQKGIGALDLRDGERLCAIALIKRLFPLVAEDVLGWNPGGTDLSVRNWPSTSYIAAVPWLKALENCGSKYALPETAKGLKNCRGETETRLFGLPQGGIFDLDGHLLHEDGIRLWIRENESHLASPGSEQDRLLKALKKDQKLLDGVAASEFYAILIMDGDRIGAKISDPANEDIVKNGLAGFTRRVKQIFVPEKGNAHDGVLIYAGGDDVLAFLPVDSALDAAHELRTAYEDAFRQAGAKNPARDFTMSAAIIFTHFKNPLRQTLEKAHHYLDDIAKDGNGRDSLAIAVMKPGGVAFHWVSCWKDAGKKMEPGREMLNVARQASGGHPKYSTSFLYNIRERYAPLFDIYSKNAGNSQAEGIRTDPQFMKAMLVAEYKKQESKAELSKEEAERDTAPLLIIGRPLFRDDSGHVHQTNGYHFDGALIARFLSVEGRWNSANLQVKSAQEASHV